MKRLFDSVFFRLLIWIVPITAVTLGVVRFWLYAGRTGWMFDCGFVLAVGATIAIGLSFLAGRASKDLDRSLYSDDPPPPSAPPPPPAKTDPPPPDGTA